MLQPEADPSSSLGDCIRGREQAREKTRRAPANRRRVTHCLAVTRSRDRAVEHASLGSSLLLDAVRADGRRTGTAAAPPLRVGAVRTEWFFVRFVLDSIDPHS